MGRPEQLMEYNRAIVEVGVTTPFWQWLQGELRAYQAEAQKGLTVLAPTADNLAEFARLQERVSLSERLLKKPYDLLGVPPPR